MIRMILIAICLWLLAIPAAFAQPLEPADLAASSGLPVIAITTPQGELPGDEDMPARLTVYQQTGSGMQVFETPIEINERGNTSRRFPKKSYRVKIVDEKGEKQHTPLLGLRSDDDWILNPMYTDTSKIREALAYSLWADMNSSGSHAASSRVAYGEVFINGDYWGLYGLQERIDRKQVDGDKRTGVLYKIIANDHPTVEELLACQSDEVCRGFELEFSGERVHNPWEPAAAYMAMLNGEAHTLPARLSLDNTIDYGLWAMLTQAHDCHFKNQFLNCVNTGSGYMMYKIPWDLNNTFGDIWQNDAVDTNHTGYHVGKLVQDGAFRVLLDSGDGKIYTAICQRWQVLRAGPINEDSIIARAHAIYEPLFDAIQRDSQRWPECGMGNGNAVNIRDIEDFIREILPRMDAFIKSLGTHKQTEE